ncbi:MAG TPA: hypothetical protein VFL57_11620 [Bryobacteraceae bacterium]|nr:hypothetical protein [Bryobacteraceae bacterium]
MMKTVLAFVVGAVLAAAIVYYKVGRETPAAEPVAQSVAPVTQAPAPQSPAPAAQAEAEPPSPVADAPARPAPRERTAYSRDNAGKGPGKPAGEKASQATSTVAENRPATAGQNSPPNVAANPGGPVVQGGTTPGVNAGAVGPSGATTSVAPPAAEPLVPKKPERVPQTVTIPAGMLLAVRIDQTLSTDRNEAGDSFRATLDAPLVIDGYVIAERGARAQGRVAEVDRGGRVRGTASMTLELVSVTGSDGQRIRVETQSFARQAQSSRGKDAAKVGAAAGLGAAIGAIAGGGKGAAIGAGIGAAAGTGGVMATRGGAAEVPAETRITFKLAQPVTVTEKLH